MNRETVEWLLVTFYDLGKALDETKNCLDYWNLLESGKILLGQRVQSINSNLSVCQSAIKVHVYLCVFIRVLLAVVFRPMKRTSLKVVPSLGLGMPRTCFREGEGGWRGGGFRGSGSFWFSLGFGRSWGCVPAGVNLIRI